MKSFADWTLDIKRLNEPDDPDGPSSIIWQDGGEYAPGCFWNAKKDYFEATCVCCGNSTEVYCDLWDFDASYHYCGGSPRCCP